MFLSIGPFLLFDFKPGYKYIVVIIISVSDDAIARLKPKLVADQYEIPDNGDISANDSAKLAAKAMGEANNIDETYALNAIGVPLFFRFM